MLSMFRSGFTRRSTVEGRWIDAASARDAAALR
ncbi:hypothetical protein K788_00023615 [Paraburkholderia caribensis MBA4]|uniref:Uncharacterized protein n=1 Tax=Paraburkholderia caribensis MBA4 TaxID=1323664 RepID=A0A0P0RKR0_9BURK|nr:hypothetical protein K788_00023615 [Paraburkholderia caribensis MBA4]